MSRDAWLVRGLLALVLLALGAWLVTATEWVDEYIDAKPQGEAQSNELYATQALVRALGATVVKRQGLDELPPPQATMVLRSLGWALTREQDVRLRQWVEQGGHLLVPAHMLDQEELGDWLPVYLQDDDEEEPPAPSTDTTTNATTDTNPDADDEAQPAKSPWETGALVHGSACHDVLEIAAQAGRKWRLCSPISYTLRSSQAPTWALQGPYGPQALRVAVGRGTVTVLGPSDIALKRAVLASDNAQVLVAAMALRPAAQVWFVDYEKPASFFQWLWAHGWTALLASALALALALWRASARFGPWVLEAQVGRRSVAEQVRGTAQFLRRQGGDALHLAQTRALEEMAARYLPQYRTLDADARAQAIGQRAALDAAALKRAMNRTLRRTPADLQAALQLLEAARRALQAASAPTRGHGAAPSSF